MSFFSENRPEYLLTQIACISDSITVAPIPIRSADFVSVSHILDQTKAGTLCVSKHTFPLILEMLEQGQLVHLKTVICFDSDLDSDLKERG
jgi:long-subunit acyl-CoA synthetase (AMP-forming)